MNREPDKKRSRNVWWALTTLDIKNNFNTAAWSIIIQTLTDPRNSAYIVKEVREYLKDRKIIVDEEIIDINAGVPQGSVPGPYTAASRIIIQSLTDPRFSAYIVKEVREYLKDRKIKVDEEIIDINGGVPQG